MPQSRETQIQELFADAAALTPDARRELLDDACRDDPSLRAEVTLLLEAHDQAGTFLSAPAVTLGESSENAQDLSGTRIGRYLLGEIIGEGGFGTVYHAHQEVPVRRECALKIVKLGMDTRRVIARFQAERQTLAILDHPNIARIFDAGTTDTGRPFFVMELVHGLPITTYCEKHGLSSRERLELFVPVCQALQHAHQKGIIHRDIKPNNVLIAERDGQPVPKIIDFGIAKTREPNDHSFSADLRQILGTPAYMSPEQAVAGAQDIDTRSDIYSMGVVLYELLTGTTPIEDRTLRAAAYEQVQKMIREFEPPPPSARVTTITAGPTSRLIESKVLSRSIRGEVDWIVMRCLEKVCERRYQTAEALCDDIQRHLRGDDVFARAPTRLYRTRKVLYRHRLAIGVGAVIAGSLIAGLVVACVALVRERRARELAQRANEASTALVTFAITRSVGDLRTEPLFFDAYERVRSAYGADHPMTIIAERNLGTLLNGRDKLEQGEALLRDALERSRRIIGPTSRETIAILPELINGLTRQRKYDEALAFDRELDSVIKDPRVDPDLRLGFCAWLGGMLTLTHRYAEARQPLLDALELLRANNGPREGIRGIMENLAEGYEATGDHDEADQLRKAIVIFQSRRSTAPTTNPSGG